jgi:hypothetical protein
MRSLGAVTQTDITNFLNTAPKVLKTAQEFTNKAAALAPRAVPVIREIIPILPYGPRLSPLAAVINQNVATILNKAPSYAPTLTQAMELMAKAPETAQQIAAVTGQMANVIQRIGEDPALEMFANRIVAIINLYQGPSSTGGGVKAGVAASTKGIGLRWVVPWLDRGLFVMKHKWILIAAPTALLLTVGAIGYGLGKRS